MFFRIAPQLYEKSLAGKTIFGLPIAAVVASSGSSRRSSASGRCSSTRTRLINPTQVMIVAGVFVLGFVFYYVMKMIRDPKE
jgi:hypothetical protein